MIYNGPAISIQRLEKNVAALRFKLPQDNTPLFHLDFFNDLDAALDCLDNESHISGLLLVDLQCSFSDMAQYYAQYCQYGTSESKLADFQAQLNRIEDYPYPTVAVIENAVYGPAAEIVLCCDYRVVTSQASIFFAAQAFGHLPSLGASVRLPRLIGLEHAIYTLQAHTPYTAQTLLDLGLADAKIDPDQALIGALKYIQLKQQTLKSLQKVESCKLSAIAQFLIFEKLRADTYTHKKLGYYPADKALIDTIEQSNNMTRSEAQQLEQHASIKIANTWQAEALTTQSGLQYSNYQVMTSQLHTVATIVNTDHSWVSHLMTYGLHIYIADTGSNFNYHQFTQALKHIHIDNHQNLHATQLSYTRYSPLNQNIECMFDVVQEPLNDKVHRLNQLQQQLALDCSVLIDTNVLALNSLADQLKRSAQVLITHRNASPHPKPLVEVITHPKVSQETLEHVFAILQYLGQTPILAHQKPDLFSQRILNAYAIVLSDLIEEGIDFSCIDCAMQNFGFLEGAAKLLDRVGLKQYIDTENTIRMNQAIIPATIQRLVDQGHYGKTHSAGFYSYESTLLEAKTHHDAYTIIYGEKPFHVVEDQYIIDRILIILCNTTLHAMSEGMLNRPQDADLALVHGFGFPDFFVGPCYYIQHIGLKEYIALCNRYAHLGTAYQAPAYIVNMLAEQQLFYAKGAV